MDLFSTALILATVLCSLVAGFVFAFAVVVMPGIRRAGDAAFLRTFQLIDRVIQDNQPLFLFVWVGSAVALVVAGGLGVWRLEGVDRWLVGAAVVVYLGGVQVPTAVVNIPLNNALQRLVIAEMNEAECGVARRDFEARWNRWNAMRTGFAVVVIAVLMVVQVRI